MFERISLDVPSNTIDSKLTKERGLKYGLYEFTFSLVDIQNRWPSRIFDIDGKRIHWADFWRKEEKRFNDLKAHILDTLDKHLNRVEFWSPNAKWTERSKREYLIDRYKLRSFYRKLYGEIRKYRKESRMPRKKGKPLGFQTKVVLLWSLVIKKKTRIDWDTISDLFEWFIFNFSGSSWGKKLKGRQDGILPEHLRRQIYAIENKGDYDNILHWLKNLYFPKEKEKPSFLINFKKTETQLYDLDYLEKDIKHFLKFNKSKYDIIAQENEFGKYLLEFYNKHKAVPLIIFPNGKSFPE